MLRASWVLALLLWATQSSAQMPARLPDLDKAMVPVVYPLESAGRSPIGCQRVRYSFFGNAFFIGCDGLLLTAAHVLEPFAKPEQISILLPDEKHAEPGSDCWRVVRARLVRADRDADVALLQVEPGLLAENDVGYFALARSAPHVGAAVEMAVFKPTRASRWTDGAARIETRRGRIEQMDSKRVRPEGALVEVYLISAEVAQGDSGAPLYDAQSGEVVGIVSGISGGRQVKASGKDPAHRGAAVPLDRIRQLLQESRLNCAAENP